MRLGFLSFVCVCFCFSFCYLFGCSFFYLIFVGNRSFCFRSVRFSFFGFRFLWYRRSFFLSRRGRLCRSVGTCFGVGFFFGRWFLGCCFRCRIRNKWVYLRGERYRRISSCFGIYGVSREIIFNNESRIGRGCVFFGRLDVIYKLGDFVLSNLYL